VATAEGLGRLWAVVHAAGVLSDGMVEQQDEQKLEEVMRPKVEGARQLDAATRGKGVEVFVLYGSAAALLGSPGQTNYAAANAELSVIARARRQAGEAALAVDWGSFSEVGLAAAEANRGARLVSRGVNAMTPAEGLLALETLLSAGPVQAGMVRLNVRQWVDFNPSASVSTYLGELLKESGRGRARGDQALLGRLSEASAAARVELLRGLVRGQVAEVLRLSAARIGPETPLKTLGIDSLMGLELRNRLEAALGLTLSATLVWSHPNVSALADFLAGKLGGEPSPAPAAAPARGEQRAEEIRREVAELSHEELADALLEELK
jgi:acyl carrier protein